MIQFDAVTIRAGEFLLPDLSFEVDSGQYAVIMGPTGIGKTTILEAICGLRSVERGRISIQGRDVTSWTPADRNIGYVPQDLALFPTLTVQEQLMFAPKLRGTPLPERKRQAKHMADLLGIHHLLERTIQGLSGGESQRVALGRALSFQPDALLLDEPLSALDADTRDAAQNLLKNINRETGVTVLHVTHNAEEAESLADRCLRLSRDGNSSRVILCNEKGAGK